MKKENTKLMTTAAICKKFGIHRHKVEQLVKTGMPTAGKTPAKSKAGRRGWLFDPDKVATWATATGRTLPGLMGNILKETDDGTPTTPEPVKQEADKAPILLQLDATRSQFTKLFSRFLKTNASTNDAEVAMLAGALGKKGEELRRLEMTALEYQQKTGDLVGLADAKRLFSELATGTRERVMAVPNQLIPQLRQYLRDDDDAGKVRDIIDKEIRRALTALPAQLPRTEARQ
jgi:hypothetical protein